MKTKSFSKIVLLTVLCLTALLAFGTMASAEDAPVAKIDSANVAYNDMVQLAFTVEVTGTLPEGAELGIIAWNEAQDSFTVSNANYATFTANEKDGVSYYKTRGIPAPEMDTPIYVAAAYLIGDEITVAQEPFSYSALQYAGTRLTATNVTANQAKLYENTIIYGMNSDVVLEGEANYAFVKAVNGTIGSAGAEIGGWYGKEVLLRAEAKNANGEYFIKWVDAEGETVSTERLAYVTVTEAGVTEYTAVFGAKAESAYATTYNFESLVATKITSTLSGVSFANNDGTNNAFYITESLSGDKQLHIDRIKSGGGSYNAKCKIDSTEQVTAFEFDVEFDETVKKGVFNNTTFDIKNSAGQTARLRINFEYHGKDTFHLYMEGDKYASVTVDNATKNFDSAVGSTFTLKMELDLDSIRAVEVEAQKYDESGNALYVKDADGNYLDKDGNITTDSKKRVRITETCTSYTADLLFYINGEYVGKIDMMDCQKKAESGSYFGDYSKARRLNADGTLGFVIDAGTTITGDFGISCLSAAHADISLDNFTYFAAK